MNGGRIDFYTKVHKGLRARLFDFSRSAGTTDFGQPGALQELSRSLDVLLAQLGTHARHEEQLIHPLLARKLESVPFESEHAALEARQGDLAGLMHGLASAPEVERRGRGLDFYRALNVFIARYLEHLDAEERTMPILWERCSDEELAAVLAGFGASRPVEEALADIGWILPALTGTERAEMIAGMSAGLARRR